MERYRPIDNQEKKENNEKDFLNSIVNFIVELTNEAFKHLVGKEDKQANL